MGSDLVAWIEGSATGQTEGDCQCVLSLPVLDQYQPQLGGQSQAVLF